MNNRIVTISREFGSGGRTIWKKVTEKPGIPCYDAELIRKLAQESGFSEQSVKEAKDVFRLFRVLGRTWASACLYFMLLQEMRRFFGD